MELRTLKYFLMIAEKENITQAAKALHMTQPTLSRQITELENDLGVTLFVRTNRNTLLTEEGILFKQRAQAILSLVEKTENEFQLTSDAIHGNITIGSVETETMHIIIDSIKRLHHRYPDIHYHFHNGNSDELINLLDDGLLDFCLRFGNVNTDQYHCIELPSTDSTGILMRSDSPYAHLKGIQLNDLLEMPLLISSRFTQDSIQLRNENGDSLDINQFNIIGTFNQIYNATLMVKSGICNAISLGSLIHSSETDGLIFVPFSPALKINSYIIWKKHQVLSKANRAFLAALEEEIARHKPL